MDVEHWTFNFVTDRHAHEHPLQFPCCCAGRIAGNLSRDTYVNVMDQYYPAHKAETEPRFAEINRGISADELCGALEFARSAGLWRFDTRWRHVIPHGAPVWLPRMQRLANTA